MGPRIRHKVSKTPPMHFHRNSKLYLGKVYTEEKIKELNEEEVENFLIITKLSYQARW